MSGRHYATGHVNKALIALVTIRATDPVAIYSIVSIRVNPCNSWAKIFRGISVAPAKDNFKLSQVVPVVVTKTDAFIDLGVKCLEGTTERSDGNRVRSARIGEVRTICLEFSCKRAQSRTRSDYAERSRKCQRNWHVN